MFLDSISEAAVLNMEESNPALYMYIPEMEEAQVREGGRGGGRGGGGGGGREGGGGGRGEGGREGGEGREEGRGVINGQTSPW